MIMPVDMDRFRSKYGKIRYLEEIEKRHPVNAICQNDINRKLMIKFKYGNMTCDEENQFHEAIKKIIYKVMHKNNVMMDWNDVYQEIWKKIIKSKHTWKEWKGTMVSTWITIVANSVINTLRQTVNRYNSRFCLYDDLVPQTSSEDDESSSDQKADALAFATDDERMQDDGVKRMMWKEQFDEFMSKLDSAEAFVFGIILSMQDDIIDSYEGRLKVPYNEIRTKSGYDEPTFAMVIYSIKKKYCETFNMPFSNIEVVPDDTDTEFLF